MSFAELNANHTGQAAVVEGLAASALPVEAPASWARAAEQASATQKAIRIFFMSNPFRAFLLMRIIVFLASSRKWKMHGAMRGMRRAPKVKGYASTSRSLR